MMLAGARKGANFLFAGKTIGLFKKDKQSTPI